MIAFVRQIDVKYHCFYIEKRKISDVVEATGMLSKQISQFIRDHYEEYVKIYYDNGQVADLLCSLKLVSLKMENNMFSKSEMMFFGNLRDLKKNYLKPLQKKEWI